MKEIKFRAWDKIEQRWYDKVLEWIFDRPKGSIGQHPIIPKDTIFMQSTNLKDKNGKEIFDGDIVKFDDGTIMNVFQSEDGSWVLDEEDNSYKAFKVYNQQEIIEIIGNKFENPELLEVKK